MVKYTGQAVLFPWNLVRFVLSDARMTGAMTAHWGVFPSPVHASSMIRRISYQFTYALHRVTKPEFKMLRHHGPRLVGAVPSHVYVLWKERRLRSRIYFPLQILINRLLPDVLQ
ncbi:hypothetical protein LshimejAT787_0703580 [Lyophyllum shimeji]|uniref:Uncharacterized protein n=1 Tax=Lyophyllum shimeji TaxID=47721 RepID=A0A9P3UNN2_LYOSH|nr:hypothetical protein LshimejAT787_0703580 [Lyophyllum shimeji]